MHAQEPKEKDDLVREYMAESLLALASDEAGRKALWAVRAPEILKKGCVDGRRGLFVRACQHVRLSTRSDWGPHKLYGCSCSCVHAPLVQPPSS